MVIAAVRRKGLSWWVRLCIGLLGVSVSLTSLAIARREPEGSFAATSVANGILELAAGWSLVAAGLLFWARRPRNRSGPLLAATGIAWFLPEWSNPGAGLSPVFTAGLVGFATCTPLVAHTALAYPSGRLGSTLERGAVAAGYVGTFALLGVLPAAVFDPGSQGCIDCPANLVLVHGDAGAYEAFLRWGLRLLLGWAIALLVLIAWRLRRSGRPFVAAPVLVAAASYTALVAWDLEHSLARVVIGNDPFDVRLWRYEALALAALAGGVAWGLVRALRARSVVARLVVDLGRSHRPGGVRDALAEALGDPNLRVVYRPAGADGYVDAQGLSVAVRSDERHAITELRRQGRPIAAVVHNRALLHDPGLIEEIMDAARLALENERFEAEMRGQLEHLRASRARIVEAGDAERRRLERDLHDGAQQRLVGLLLVLRMLRAELGSGLASGERHRLDVADSEVRRALSDLRALAHGIFPAALADEGLAAAVETLIDDAEAEVDMRELPAGRFPPPVETAAYLLIAETLKRTGATRAAIDASYDGDSLVVELQSDGTAVQALTDVEDRIGALGGHLQVAWKDGQMRVHAVLPCG